MELLQKSRRENIDESQKCETILVLFEALEYFNEGQCKGLYKELDYNPAEYSALTTIKKALNITEDEYGSLIRSYGIFRMQLTKLQKGALNDQLSVIQNKITTATDKDTIKSLSDKQNILTKNLEVLLAQEEDGTDKVPVDEMSHFYMTKVWKNKTALIDMLAEIGKRLAIQFAEKLDNTQERDEDTVRVVNPEYDRVKELGIKILLPTEDGYQQDVTNQVILSGFTEAIQNTMSLYLTSEVVTDYLDRIIHDTKYVI